MDIKKRDFLAVSIGASVGLAATSAIAQQAAPAAAAQGQAARVPPSVNSGVQPLSVDMNYKPRRLNKAIELWEDGQPVYYTSAGLGFGVDSYAQGVKMARTWADAIDIGMEHTAVDLPGVRDFMRGLADGGPTRSGHRIPAVFVEFVLVNYSKAQAEANQWLVGQLLDCGVHGVHFCHSRDPEAVQVCAQLSMRYPFNYPGVPKLPIQGLRGSSASGAAQVWGVNINRYNHVADLWPLNPRGEIMCGVHIEDTYAVANAEKTLAVPGVTFAEWGPGDLSYWLYGLSIMPEDGARIPDVNQRPEMLAVRRKVLDLCKKNKIMFLNAANTDPNNGNYIITQIKDGAMLFEAPEAAAIIGREYTKRKMPV